jgi:beta-phosphoglucomutase-like phosphatase (HAD superfamily)
MASRWPLGLASSSPRLLIDLVLDRGGLRRFFAVTLSTDEIHRGKPAPDVYLQVARELDEDPARCAAIEDSSNGLRSAARAGLLVVAVPRRGYPPDPDAIAEARAVLPDLSALTPELVEGLASTPDVEEGR